MTKKEKGRWPLHNFTMLRELHKLLEEKEKDNFGLSDAIRNLVQAAKGLPKGLLRNSLNKTYDAKSYWIRMPEELFEKLSALAKDAHIKMSMVINWLVFNSLRDELTPEEVERIEMQLFNEKR